MPGRCRATGTCGLSGPRPQLQLQEPIPSNSNPNSRDGLRAELELELEFVGIGSWSWSCAIPFRSSCRMVPLSAPVYSNERGAALGAVPRIPGEVGDTRFRPGRGRPSRACARGDVASRGGCGAFRSVRLGSAIQRPTSPSKATRPVEGTPESGKRMKGPATWVAWKDVSSQGGPTLWKAAGQAGT